MIGFKVNKPSLREGGRGGRKGGERKNMVYNTRREGGKGKEKHGIQG